MNHPKHSRRQFLNNAVGLVAAGGISSFVPKLNIMGEALAQANTSGYKALVCLYFDGGNDSWNMLIPTGLAAGPYDHNQYVASRNGLYTASNTGGLAIPRVATAGALPPAVALTNTSGNLGVNPFMPEVAALYNSNRLAFVANVGTVVEPLTRAAYNARKKPPQLYSHNDQTNLWYIGTSSNTETPVGFGGMVAGFTSVPNPSLPMPSAISISGQTRFLVGKTLANAAVSPFQVSSSATTPAPVLSNYNAGSATPGEPQRRNALTQLFNQAYPQLFSAEYKDIFNRSLTLSSVINAQITSPQGAITATFPNTSLGNQLRQVARFIKISRPGFVPPAGQPNINANRQVYFVRIGGFDTHDAQITSTTAPNGHHGLLQQISQALNSFNNAMNEIGAASEVTLFTMSDFARTINSNGNGTDHSWGSLQMVMGGAVTGGAVYGRYPSMKLDNRIGGTGAVTPDQGECFSRGQFLPTTASDQLGASLARWMGVDNSNLPLIFPNIDNFATGPFANAASTPTFANFNRVIPNLMAGIT